MELLGERQAALGLAMEAAASLGSDAGALRTRKTMQRPAPLASRLTPEAEAAHLVFIETLGAKALWRRYVGGAAALAVTVVTKD